jgi:hypothetical protein
MYMANFGGQMKRTRYLLALTTLILTLTSCSVADETSPITSPNESPTPATSEVITECDQFKTFDEEMATVCKDFVNKYPALEGKYSSVNETSLQLAALSTCTNYEEGFSKILVASLVHGHILNLPSVNPEMSGDETMEMTYFLMGLAVNNKCPEFTDAHNNG